jgi:uncharacterized RmlC-like cupin family protein
LPFGVLRNRITVVMALMGSASDSTACCMDGPATLQAFGWRLLVDSVNATKSWYLASAAHTTMELSPQAQRLMPLVSRSRGGSSQISLGTVVMPPGGISKAHVHETYELVVGVVEGLAASLMGAGLEPVVQGPGDFLFIPGGVPHVAVNLSTVHRVVAIEARADPEFNNDVVLLPELDAAAIEIAGQVRAQYRERITESVITDLI